jgi:hypothetical protein
MISNIADTMKTRNSFSMLPVMAAKTFCRVKGTLGVIISGFLPDEESPAKLPVHHGTDHSHERVYHNLSA